MVKSYTFKDAYVFIIVYYIVIYIHVYWLKYGLYQAVNTQVQIRCSSLCDFQSCIMPVWHMVQVLKTKIWQSILRQGN